MSTQPEPTIVTRPAAENAAQVWLSKDAIAKQAKAEADKAREVLLSTLSDADGPVVHVPAAKTVAVSQRSRRAVPLDEVADKVTKKVLSEITVLAIDLAKFDAAVKLGHISPEVAEAVTVKTPYTDVRVVK